MATLMERITGDNLPDNPEPDEEKLSVHSFWGMIHEWQRGYESQANILSGFNLTGSQLTDGQVIKQRINAIPTIEGQTTFIRVCKDWAYVGESTAPDDPNATKYHDWDAFVLRMDNEVLDQGGTLP